MAVIRYFDNCFENDFIDVEYDFQKPLIEQIESHKNDSYSSEMIECYCPEEDKTFYVPLTGTEDRNVVISVNGVNVNEDYEVNEHDIVNVVFLPMSDRVGFDIAGGLVGAVAGAIIGVSLAVFTAGASVAIYALMFGLVGLAAGAFMADSYYTSLNSKTITDEKGSSLPDVRGGSNGSILNAPYGLVIGKHLVNPRVIADPYTEYSQDGKDAFIRVVYEVGYAPLKITDIKLDEFLLSKNTSPNYLNGFLKGSTDTSGDTTVEGDIEERWKNNEIELEILQHNPNIKDNTGKEIVNFGHIYPDVKKQKEINANVLFVNDDAIRDNSGEITYKGKTFASRYRTNGVWFTSECPSSFTITLNAPSGLYDSYTETKTENNTTTNTTKYDKLPLWLAIQYRPYSKYNKESNAEGADYFEWKNITTWNNEDCSALYTDTERNADIAAHKGNSITNITTETKGMNVYFTPSEVLQKCIASTSSGGSNLKHSENGVYFNNDVKKFRIPNSDYNSAPSTLYWGRICNSYSRDSVIDTATKHIWLDVSNSDITGDEQNELITVTLSADVNVTLNGAVKLNEYHNETDKGSETTVTAAVRTVTMRRKYYHVIESYYSSDVGFWASNGNDNKVVCNFKDHFTGKSTNKDFTGQVRLSSTVTLTDEEKKQMLASDNTISGIEIRVIRLSPNYINQNESSSDTQGAHSYSDSVVVDMITTTIFDEDKYKKDGVFQSVKFQSENLMKKMCYIAIKAKADDLGQISQQLKQLSCTVESFSPVWQDYKWLPENVRRVTKYYGYYDKTDRTKKVNRSSNATEIDLNEKYISAGKSETEAEALAKSDYEQARIEGYSWYADEIGSNFSSLIKKEVFPSDGSGRTTHNDYNADILQDSAMKFNDATVASGFMLAAVGAHNGQYALGYENIDLLSVAECYDAQQSVKDGSTYSESDGEHIEGDDVEIKFEANGYVYQTQKLEDLLAKIAIAGRCVYTYDNCGRIKLIMDKPVDYPRGVINQQNCISHSASYTYDKLPAGLRIEFPDENDGYDHNSLYCWSDGNSISNYKGNVENYNFDFVTKNVQAWSLGRYVLANRVLNREALTAKIGMEGETWGLGDVIVFQDEDLFIGGGSGRVREIIRDDEHIYGFMMDSVYTYKGETETVDDQEVCKQGVQVFTPKKYGNARVQDFRLATPDYILTVEDEVYQMTVGETNLVLFDSAINTTTSIEDVHYDDIVMFGDYTKISALYRVIKVKPEKDHTYSYNLIQYTEDLYNYGAKLPSFQNYMTVPSPTAEGVTLSETPTTVKEKVEADTEFQKKVYKDMLTGSEPYYAVTNTTTMPDTDVFYDEGEYRAGVFCKNMETVIAHYDDQFRYFWTGIRFVYADGTKESYITNVTLAVYGEQGVAGTDFKFDLSPEAVYLNPITTDTFRESEINISCFLFKETEVKSISSIECYLRNVDASNKLTCTSSDITEGGVLLGQLITIPTNQFKGKIDDSASFPIIVVCKFADGANTKSRMATLTVSPNSSGVRYYFYLDYTNVKINADGEVTPKYIVATPLKLTSAGVYTAAEGEGGNVIKYRILPEGEYKTVGHDKVKSTDTFDETVVYHGKFYPQVAYKNNADGTFDYSKCWTVRCSDDQCRAIMFFTRVNQ